MKHHRGNVRRTKDTLTLFGKTSMGAIRRGCFSNCRSASLTILAAFAYGCGGSPTAPSTSGALLSMSCGEVVNGYQCGVSVADSPGGPQRDVTGLARWSTSDTSIATVNSVGFVTALKNGDVAIRVNYRRAEDFMTLSVRPGGANYYFRALSGWITNAQDNAKVGGVTARILAGPNANRTAMTGPDGAYQMYELEPGTFTIRFSKPGYVTADRAVFLPGDRFNSLDVQLIRVAQ